jgi:hypothetical protein
MIKVARSCRRAHGALPADRPDRNFFFPKKSVIAWARSQAPEAGALPNRRPREALSQKQVHAVEIDDGLILVERINSQNAADYGAALLQRVTR